MKNNWRDTFILWWGNRLGRGNHRGLLILLLVLGLLWACNPDDKKEEPKPDTDLITGTYAPEDYVLNIPRWMPPIPSTASNPLTKAGVALGRMLFYDPILSRDSSQSCASCHLQAKGFTDGLATSRGIRGQNGTRSAMPLVNLAYNTRGFFWDGRSVDLEGQALLPIEDHLEMDDTWDNVERKLRRHKDYPGQFRQAFGISRKTELTRDLVVKALSQFERTLISAYSRYDRVIWAKEDFPTDEEQRGLELFFIEYSRTQAHPGCSHCHFNPLFTDNNYHNNGLDNVPNLSAFKDLGRGKVTGLQSDNGRFRTPSLRNVALSAPYMHDGRFKTLEEVLENYSRGGHGVANEDANITGFPLSEQDKSDLIAFLKMLTDTSFVNNPAFSNPFKR